jgi:hypothetical protein
MHLKLTGPRVPENETVLARLGFLYCDDSTYRCDVPADASNRLVKAHQAGEIAWDQFSLLWPVFSESELEKAAFLSVWGYPRYGYPQPENTYRSSLYSERTCQTCVGGLKQTGSLKLKSAPKLSAGIAFSLHWERQVMMTTDVYDTLFQDCPEAVKRPVFCGDKMLPNIVQLDSTSKVNLAITATDFREVCRECGLERYHPNPLSDFYAPIDMKKARIALSRQFVGNSANVWWFPLIVDRTIYQRAKVAKVKGLLWSPCRAVPR